MSVRQGSFLRPSLAQGEIVTLRRGRNEFVFITDSTRNRKSKLSGSFVTFAWANHRQPHKHISFFKVDDTNFDACDWIDTLLGSITIVNPEASHIVFVLLEYCDAVNGGFVESYWFKGKFLPSIQLWLLILLVLQFHTRKILIILSPSTEGNLLNLHVRYVCTTLKTRNGRPSIRWGEPMTHRLRQVWLVLEFCWQGRELGNHRRWVIVAHQRKPYPSGLSLRVTHTGHSDSDELIVRLECDRAGLCAIVWVNHIWLSITVVDLETSHIGVIRLPVDDNWRNRNRFEAFGLPGMPLLTEKLRSLTSFVRQPQCRKIIVTTAPPAKGNLGDPHLIHVLTVNQVLNLWPSLNLLAITGAVVAFLWRLEDSIGQIRPNYREPTHKRLRWLNLPNLGCSLCYDLLEGPGLCPDLSRSILKVGDVQLAILLARTAIFELLRELSIEFWSNSINSLLELCQDRVFRI